MWSRLGRDDFSKTKELKFAYGLTAKGWGVCEEYEIEEVPTSEQFRKVNHGWVYVGSARIVNKYSVFRQDKWRYYDPINDTPDLFLEFARLNETDLLPDTILGWVKRYGFLGLNNQTDWLYGYFDPEYDEAINEMTKVAAAVLKGYEAVLNGDGDAAKRIVFSDFHRAFRYDWPSLRYFNPRLESELSNFEEQDMTEVLHENYEGDYLWYLLDRCAEIVQEMVREFSWPTLKVGEKPRRPVRVASGWHIRNLLGAMYLQMYRLMAAGNEVTTCRYCGKVISLKRSKVGERKPRQDRKYCSDACRQRYNYHNRVKPRRQNL